MHNELLAYRPMGISAPDLAKSGEFLADESTAKEGSQPEATPREMNQSIFNLQQRNAEALGWLSVPGTKIDYPFVQTEDNSYYLARNIDKEQASAGTLFLDYRNNAELLDFSSLIYGHHMRNGSMFGSLLSFEDQAFFDEHPIGILHLSYDTYELEIFAYMVVRADNATIYNNFDLDIHFHSDYFQYIAENARRYRDISLMPGDRILALSTCTYEFSNARTVLLSRLKAK
jgi:sortase, SrtB family